MSGTLGLVADLLPSSWVDGPGNRFVVFLQGCDFDCVACHNPQTINPCSSCGDCLAGCSSGALSLVDGAMRWEAATCTGGDACIAACSFDSSPKARWLSVDDVVEHIRRAAPFISGVTVSGGEATQQPRFVAELFGALAAHPQLGHLSRLVDTNGGAPLDVWDRLAPVTHGFLVDLKAFDPEVHERLTGRPLAPVLGSLRHLAGLGLLREVRMLLVDGVNDDPATVGDAASWLAAVAPDTRVQLTSFRCHGVRPTTMTLGAPRSERMQLLAQVVEAAGLPRPVVV